MSLKERVKECALSQPAPFYTTTIMTITGASIALVNNALTELVSTNQLTSRREGKKYLYSVSGVPQPLSINISSPAIQPQTSNLAASLSNLSVSDRFEYIRSFVRMVINKINPSALITGRPGVGKSYLVRDELSKQGLKMNEDYISITGYSTAFGLYETLHNNRDRFIVFDDCDSILRDPKAINLLKGALDSYDTRMVSWVSDKCDNKGLDSTFEFTGRIIFISNLYASQIDDAILSRSFCMELHMSNTEVTEHMSNILPHISVSTPLEHKQEVLKYIDSISSQYRCYGLRALLQAIRISELHPSQKEWQRMVQVLASNVR